MLVTKAGGKYGQYDVKELLPRRHSPPPAADDSRFYSWCTVC